ncbi:polyamine-modulated factor 1 isoform X2 [Alligator mississippiensis]|uniref:Nnf1 protein n=1 Tax=Alligator mississippiensis TaxID=8496 RepID=A0A151NYQ9_ALLMI|nr:polyamine-modulated factor 1 isoform X2 [Alligator mississippiensis]KYO41790.1 Nnf1 protein [Alligator mississippiensis]
MAAAGGGERGEDAGAGPATDEATPGRGQLFDTVVETFLEKLVTAGSYQRFANCYHRFYKLQPEMTRGIYDQFIFQLQTSIREEIREIKEEGNLEALFNSLDKIVEEAKNREEPAWRPSGIPEEDVRSAMVPYYLKHAAQLQKLLKAKKEENRKLVESVLAGRERIAELQQRIQSRKQAWQAISKEQRELIAAFKEPE